MRIYISGKISDLTKEKYEKNFEASIFELVGKTMALRNNIINPLNIKPLFGIKKWLFFIISDILALRKCTHIAMQKNWEDSKGAFIEHFIAKFILKLKVIKLKHECL